jgi:hypothetical protein
VTDIEKLFEEETSVAESPGAEEATKKPAIPAVHPKPAETPKRTVKPAEPPKPKRPRAAKARGDTLKVLRVALADKIVQVEDLQKKLETSEVIVKDLRERLLRTENDLLHLTNQLRAKEIQRLTDRGHVIEKLNSHKEQWERDAFEWGRFYQFQLDHPSAQQTNSAAQSRFYYQQRQAKRARQE